MRPVLVTGLPSSEQSKHVACVACLQSKFCTLSREARSPRCGAAPACTGVLGLQPAVAWHVRLCFQGDYWVVCCVLADGVECMWG